MIPTISIYQFARFGGRSPPLKIRASNGDGVPSRIAGSKKKTWSESKKVDPLAKSTLGGQFSAVSFFLAGG